MAAKATAAAPLDDESAQPEGPREEPAATIHPLVLAGVGGSAVAYAAYEYRHDMANRLEQFRRYFRVRREARVKV